MYGGLNADRQSQEKLSGCDAFLTAMKIKMTIFCTAL